MMVVTFLPWSFSAWTCSWRWQGPHHPGPGPGVGGGRLGGELPGVRGRLRGGLPEGGVVFPDAPVAGADDLFHVLGQVVP
jgi:hypothetical protein